MPLLRIGSDSMHAADTASAVPESADIFPGEIPDPGGIFLPVVPVGAGVSGSGNELKKLYIHKCESVLA